MKVAFTQPADRGWSHRSGAARLCGRSTSRPINWSPRTKTRPTSRSSAAGGSSCTGNVYCNLLLH
eukprot:scaffold46299_cov53-Phaeocystis_antarctica.AAC.1